MLGIAEVRRSFRLGVYRVVLGSGWQWGVKGGGRRPQMAGHVERE